VEFSAPPTAARIGKKFLYKDENTGGIDVAYDPHNPTFYSPLSGKLAALPGA